MARLYLIPGLTTEQLDRLDDAEVSYKTESVQSAKVSAWKLLRLIGLAGSDTETHELQMFDEKNYRRLLSYLGGRQVQLDPLDAPAVFRPTIVFDQLRKPIVRVFGWQEERGVDRRPFVQIVREELLKAMQVDVILHCDDHPRPSRPQANGAFNIHLWASPLPETQVRRLEGGYAFGMPMPVSKQVFLPSGKGIAISDSQHFAIGELFDSMNAYCLFAAMATGNVTEQRMFRHFCRRLVALLRDAKAARTLEEQAAERKHDLERREYAYVARSIVRESGQATTAGTKVQDARKKVEAAQRAFQLAEQEFLLAEQELAQQQNTASSAERLARAEFRRFLADPKYIQVEPYDRGIKIWTRMLYCFDKQSHEIRRIGEMRIELTLPLGTTSGSIKVFNLTQLDKQNRHHPHINNSGEPCLGTSRDLFAKLFNKRDLYALAAYAIQYIESTNGSPPDWTEWPLVCGQELEDLRKHGLLPLQA